MTLRRIHQNLHSIKNQKHTTDIQHIPNHGSILYDEDEPPHPKMFVQSPVKWGNSRIKADITKNGLKSSTARESRRQDPGRTETGNLTALNTSRRSKFQNIGPSNNNSPRQPQELFVPERKKLIEQNKLGIIKSNKKALNTSISSFRKKSISNEQKQEISEVKLNEFSQMKLIQPNKTIHHISHLRKYENEQKQRQTLLNNRLKFITIGNQKDSKKLQMAKRKFEKVVTIRSQSLKEKQILSKTKSIIQKQDLNYKFSKVNSVKEHENNRRLSISRLSHGKSMQASILRQEQKNNERQILSSRLTELQKKKEAVRSAQSSLEKSRERISEMNRSRISSIRSIENKALIKNYMNVQKRQKINEKLTQTLQKEIKLINERKLKAASELKEYEELLGLSRKKSKQTNLLLKDRARISIDSHSRSQNNTGKLQRAVSSTFNSSGSKSFYLTNY